MFSYNVFRNRTRIGKTVPLTGVKKMIKADDKARQAAGLPKATYTALCRRMPKKVGRVIRGQIQWI
jgi:hypothetical protein